ncbi:Fungalysin metallopeptidase-domain-containing protein [Mycena leptocephala]|nr:Fungalysin metallopeptidase-domain-containing protein [Mycena leptocephala]
MGDTLMVPRPRQQPSGTTPSPSKTPQPPIRCRPRVQLPAECGHRADDDCQCGCCKVNAFYIVNTIHDLSYRYGFREAAFNFQNNNFGKDGAGNDRVTISVQNSAGIDNTDFSTPPDGQSGAMRMFLWDLTNPERDGALENDIVTHENTHGITNRMTGGGTGRCLQTTEAGGMGGGWSDAMADWSEKPSSAVPDYVPGQYERSRWYPLAPVLVLDSRVSPSSEMRFLILQDVSYLIPQNHQPPALFEPANPTAKIQGFGALIHRNLAPHSGIKILGKKAKGIYDVPKWQTGTAGKKRFQARSDYTVEAERFG